GEAESQHHGRVRPGPPPDQAAKGPAQAAGAEPGQDHGRGPQPARGDGCRGHHAEQLGGQARPDLYRYDAGQDQRGWWHHAEQALAPDLPEDLAHAGRAMSYSQRNTRAVTLIPMIAQTSSTARSRRGSPPPCCSTVCSPSDSAPVGSSRSPG